MPRLLYGLNACPLNATEKKSIDFVIFGMLAKIVETLSREVINECRAAIRLPLAANIIKTQKIDFSARYHALENHFFSRIQCLHQFE